MAPRDPDEDGWGNDITKEECYEWCSDPERGYWSEIDLGVDMCCDWQDRVEELTQYQTICAIYKGGSAEQTTHQEHYTGWTKIFQFEELDDMYDDETVNGGEKGDSTFLEQIMDFIAGEDDGSAQLKVGSAVAAISLYFNIL